MTENLPQPTRLAYARQLADEAKTLVPGMERLSAIAEELRADDLYRLLGFDTWERFCSDYLGVAKSTANRWIAGQKAKSIGAGQRVAAAQNAPVVESKALNSAKQLAGGPGKAAASVASKPGIDDPGSVPPPADPSSGGADVQPPAGPTGEAPTSPPPAQHPPSEKFAVPEYVVRPPSDRALTARVFAAMREVDPTDAGPVTTPEEATFLRQWAQRTLDAWKAVYAPPAPAEKPQRRQGTITRPPVEYDRRNPASAPGAADGSLTRHNVTRTDKPQVRTLTAKRHALDCSCLGCKPAKAVGK